MESSLSLEEKDQSKIIPLFKYFPNLQDEIAHIPLINSPTPIRKLDLLGEKLGISKLYCKDDGPSTPFYGGNKCRKLEFLLADALRKKTKRIITYGTVGSNHCIATAVSAKSVGIATTVILTNQPKSEACKTNLLYHTMIGTEIIHASYPEFAKKTEELIKLYQEKDGVAPYVIPLGGTEELGTLGTINGALELVDQIESGELPDVDVIYVAAGSFGTAIGIFLGMKLLKRKTEVRSICVCNPKYCSQTKINGIVDETILFLKSKGVNLELTEEIKIEDYFGEGYGVETSELKEIVDLVFKLEKITLDHIYTAKSMLAVCNDAQKGELKDKVVLFWRTNNSIDLSQFTSKGNPDLVPEDFKKYLE